MVLKGPGRHKKIRYGKSLGNVKVCIGIAKPSILVHSHAFLGIF